ncbi:hypothetical protein B9Y64_06325 [Stenotrophomonas maltophilia]|uniref:YagK/YfjJ C-terminal domain-containing protein n=2 Tax=Stenotrophomonas maltophilia TaxID=40324 RepID=A0A2J0UCN0_STEMA|nr:hypothetical protein B9Y64_06325 [Stenotrophomonas maltophilia]
MNQWSRFAPTSLPVYATLRSLWRGMYKKEENIVAQWADRMIEHEGDAWIFRPSSDYPEQIVRVDRVMRALVKSRSEMFWSRRVAGMARTAIHPIARALRKCANMDYGGIKSHFCKQKLSPYFELLAEEFLSHRADVIEGASPEVAAANAWVEHIRTIARSSEFTRRVATQERSARKNAKAALGYLQTLYRQHSRLCVVRLDVGYSAAHRELLPGRNVDPVRIKRDLATCLRKLRRSYPALMGYVWKLEFGPSKSYHVHLMAFLNGHLVRQDVRIAQAIGEFWQDEVTHFDGSYWNCNARKEFYERTNSLGIGMVEHDDEAKRRRLEYSLLYLTKADYYVRLSEPGLGRTFGKGQAGGDSSRKLGRPRM